VRIVPAVRVRKWAVLAANIDFFGTPQSANWRRSLRDKNSNSLACEQAGHCTHASGEVRHALLGSLLRRKWGWLAEPRLSRRATCHWADRTTCDGRCL